MSPIEHGPQYWRSLEELADTEEFRQYVESEFPRHATAFANAPSRREFLRLMAASFALAGLAGCSSSSTETIVPYVRMPEDVVPGKPQFFATAMELGGFATGLLAESHLGRPIKVEGNPEHPASLGATDSFAQASVLTLYDPERAQVITNAGRISTWDSFITELATRMEEQRLGKGMGLRILTETVTSPALAAQMSRLLTEFPAARWYQYDPVGSDNARAGARMAFGRHADTLYRFEQADVILSLDRDLLQFEPGRLRYSREIAKRRRTGPGQVPMNRLYVAESSPSLTGAIADHRFIVRSSEIEAITRAIAGRLGVPGGDADTAAPPWLEAVVRDLESHRGAGVVVAGLHQPASVHALVHRINQALGNAGSTVVYTEPVEASPAVRIESLRELTQEMQSGAVEMLIIAGGNPVFSSPADLEFSRHLDNVRLRVHHSLYYDETSEMCQWHVPQAHYLESWGDSRAYDGTVTIQQPLIDPLYQGKTIYQLLSALLGQPARTTYEIIQDYWRTRLTTPDFETAWRRAVHDGIVPNTASAELKLSPAAAADSAGAGAAQTGGVEVTFRPDPTIFDGRFANNSWLQELPKPLTKLTWDNPALISPATAERLELANSDIVELRHQGRTLRAPVWIMPGQADDAITVFFGYGRTRSGSVGTDRGYNGYALRTSVSPWILSNVEVIKTGVRYDLVSTQDHHSLENRPLIRSATADEYAKDPEFAHHEVEDPAPETSLYPSWQNEGNAWGMTIDLSTCTGCNACVTACQAENNIPVVGKVEVGRGREMHWLRIDRYFSGEPENAGAVFQPMLCMHCENAPCEPVCPVGATTHSSEGLNEMTYNRCVGTRYCSNNCPYKVRRFNFFQYSITEVPSLKLLYNPDVTVRSRGVMEKCTYCVQRINQARISAKKEDRAIRDGEVVTACQAVCPADAIVFGNIQDPESRVARLKAEARNYGILTELNTRPRTTYLARLRNPNPEIA